MAERPGFASTPRFRLVPRERAASSTTAQATQTVIPAGAWTTWERGSARVCARRSARRVGHASRSLELSLTWSSYVSPDTRPSAVPVRPTWIVPAGREPRTYASSTARAVISAAVPVTWTRIVHGDLSVWTQRRLTALTLGSASRQPGSAHARRRPLPYRPGHHVRRRMNGEFAQGRGYVRKRGFRPVTLPLPPKRPATAWTTTAMAPRTSRPLWKENTAICAMMATTAQTIPVWGWKGANTFHWTARSAWMVTPVPWRTNVSLESVPVCW